MASDERAAKVYNYVAKVMHFRRMNPAMWRGDREFNRYRNGEAEVLIVTKTDAESGNKVVMAFADHDTTEIIPGIPYPVEPPRLHPRTPPHRLRISHIVEKPPVCESPQTGGLFFKSSTSRKPVFLCFYFKVCCQAQALRIVSSRVSRASQPSTSLAWRGSAHIFSMSPSRRGPMR